MLLFGTLEYFAEETDAKSKYFKNNLSNYQFIYTTYMLLDVLAVLTELCLIFQKANVDLACIDSSVRRVKEDLKKYKAGVLDRPTYVDELQQHISRENGKYIYKGVHVIKMCSNVDTCHKIKESFIDELLANLEARFPQNDTDIVSSFSCLGLRPVTVLSESELKDWGNDKIETLCAHFGKETLDESGKIIPAFVDCEQVRREWPKVKQCIKDNAYPRQTIAQLWSILNEYHAGEFPALMKLAQVCLVLPVHTSDCERAFSSQNTLKTPLRNRLTPEHLNLLMQICVNGPLKDNFDFAQALSVWKKAKQRKIYSKKL